ncbi:MAG TPA: ABC transporter permease [Acidimicrobiia bacterium]|nr:ABC transporter permease [Acidimicrobiia bacterium]
MLKYVAKRLIQGLLLLMLFLALLYILLDAQPGDISLQLSANPRLPPEAQEIVRERLGLDQPLLGRTVTYVFNFFQGDLGLSFTQYPRTVGSVILEKLPRTILLFLSATILAYYMGFALGKVMAWRRGKTVETGLTLGGVAAYTVFYPWFAILMLWFWGFQFGLFPLGKFIDVEEWTGAPMAANRVFMRMLISLGILGLVLAVVTLLAHRLPPERGEQLSRYGPPLVLVAFLAFWWFSPLRSYVADIAHHTLLPVLTLASVQFAGVMLLTRASMLETLKEDYILTARAKGLPQRDIRNRHAARNALLPVVTSLVLALSFVIGGGILTEGIFSWPGIGGQLLDATLTEDIPLATGTLGVIGIIALIGHLISDVLYMYLDPRIRTS